MTENWMSKIPDEKKIVLMNIPGSHDSTAFNIAFFGSTFAKTQDLSISEQLKIGVRIVDIRVVIKKYGCCGKLEKYLTKDKDLICCHGACDCYYIKNNKRKNLTYKEVLTQIKQFLTKYPTETIIIKTQSGRENANLNMKRATEIYSKIIGDISIDFNKYLTMRQVRGKVINTTYLKQTENKDKASMNKYDSRLEKSILAIGIHRFFTDNDLEFDEYKVNGDLKVKEIKYLRKIFCRSFEEVEEEFKRNYEKYFPLYYETSCTGEYTRLRIPLPLPKTESNIVNKYLKKLI